MPGASTQWEDDVIKMMIANVGDRPFGIPTTDGLVIIPPGEAHPMEFAGPHGDVRVAHLSNEPNKKLQGGKE